MGRYQPSTLKSRGVRGLPESVFMLSFLAGKRALLEKVQRSAGELMQVTDLTWLQLEVALGTQGAIAVVDGRLMIDAGRITGDTINTLSSQGVCEFMHKLREACSAAQSTANNGVAIGNRLAAFPAATATSPVNGWVTVTQSIITRVPLNYSTITGTVQ